MLNNSMHLRDTICKSKISKHIQNFQKKNKMIKCLKVLFLNSRLGKLIKGTQEMLIYSFHNHNNYNKNKKF